MDSNLLKTKSIEQLVGDVEHGTKALKRTLTAMDLTLLGIGAIIGTGIFVLTGTAAARAAGPAIVLSYVLAGVACGFAALCYAEFAAMIPISGSAYTYAYATLGEIFAWMIGWDLILEYAVGSMTVAVGWSGYFQRILAGFDLHLPIWMMAAPAAAPGAVINLPAVLIVVGIMVLLVVGVRESARFNAVMVAIKLAAVLFFIAVGVTYVKPANWSPFMPYGFPGVMTGAAVVFFAYIGFDAVSTTAEEAKNPSRDLPIGIIASLIICTLLYLIVAAILSGIVPVVQFKNDAQFLNAPVGYALAVIHKDWAAGLVSAGAVCGITSVLLVMLMSQPRIFFAMSRDRLLPAGASKVHPTFKTPYVTTIITGVIVSIAAALVPIQILGEMTSIGTLFAFMIVCSAVMVLRMKRATAERLLSAAADAQAYGLAAAHIGEIEPLVVISVATDTRQWDYRTLFNPEILAVADTTQAGPEGSVSMPGIEAPIERPDWADIAYDTADGERVTTRFEGFVARCALHEIEQMNGVFFLSRLSRLKRDTAIRKFQKLGRSQ